MTFARVTCEFIRPVPLRRLAVSARPSRPGRLIQLMEAEIQAGGEVVVRGEVRDPGPAAAWFRLRGRLVEGEEPTPLQRIVDDHGVGLAESTLWDSEGPIGHSLQSLVVGRRS